MFLFQFIFLLLPFLYINSLNCYLKLTCKNQCSNFKLINGKTTGESTLSLTTASTQTNMNGEIILEQYDEHSFNCQPGDKITFSATNVETDSTQSGFIGYLKI